MGLRSGQFRLLQNGVRNGVLPDFNPIVRKVLHRRENQVNRMR